MVPNPATAGGSEENDDPPSHGSSWCATTSCCWLPCATPPSHMAELAGCGTLDVWLLFLTHLVPIGLQYGGGSTNSQTWFLSKFSNSSCIAFTQFESESACPIPWTRKTQQKLNERSEIFSGTSTVSCVH
jgi:hypothetical protein